MVMAAAALFLVVMVVLMVVTAAALVIVVVMFVVVMVMMLVVLLQLGKLCCQSGLALHGLHQLLTGELGPGGGDNGSLVIVLPEHGNGSIQLCLGNGIGTGQNDGGSGFDLVVVELAEVLHIDLHLAGIHHRNGIAQRHIFADDLIHGADDIGQLANTGGLNEDPVGMVLRNHLLQRLAEVTHQTAADAAGVHFGDIDACILQEAAVNANFAKLIFNEHQFLTGIAFCDQLFDQRGLTGTQEAGENINFCHSNTFCKKIST